MHARIALARMSPRRIALAAAAIALGLCAFPAAAGQIHRYSLDGANSAVSARVGILGIASKTAHFPEVSGGIRLDPASPGPIDLDVTLNARALKAGDRATLERLKGPQFFDVERHPAIRFAGRTMRLTGRRTAEIDGELTARGVTRREVLHVTFASEPAQITGREPVTFNGTMSIDRRNYGMTSLSLLVGHRVTIAIRARMTPS